MRPASCWRKRGVNAGEEAAHTACGEHEAELTVAPSLLAALPLAGRLVTGDALYYQRTVCQQILDAEGQHLVVVKENQSTLYAGIALLFAEPPPGEVFGVAQSCDRHGDRMETRRIWVSTALVGYLDWPGVQQVARVERVCEQKGQTTAQVRYVITSQGIHVTPLRVLRGVRGHWSIENRLHYVRDVTFGEDASQVRTGAAPEVMAALRNAVIGILRIQGHENIAAALRHYAWCPRAVYDLFGIPPPEE